MTTYIQLVAAFRKKETNSGELNPPPIVNVRAENDMLFRIMCIYKNFHLVDWLLVKAEEYGSPFGDEIYSILKEMGHLIDDDSIATLTDNFVNYRLKKEQEKKSSLIELLPVVNELVPVETPIAEVIQEQTPVVIELVPVNTPIAEVIKEQTSIVIELVPVNTPNPDDLIPVNTPNPDNLIPVNTPIADEPTTIIDEKPTIDEIVSKTIEQIPTVNAIPLDEQDSKIDELRKSFIKFEQELEDKKSSLLKEQNTIVNEVVLKTIIPEQSSVEVIDEDYVQKWSEQLGHKHLNEFTYRLAIINDRLDILIWLVNNKLRFTPHQIYETAIGYNKMNVMKWAYAIKKYEITFEVCDLAVANGRTVIIKWLKDVAPKNYNFCTSAARYGKLDILKWAYENGFALTPWICIHAAKNNNLEILKWARSLGCSWNFWVAYFAAENNNLSLLQWAITNGCGWNSSICTVAARKGYFEILKWAINNGCPYDKDACLKAATIFEVIQFLHVYQHNPITIMEQNVTLTKESKLKDEEILNLQRDLKCKDSRIEDLQAVSMLKIEKCDKLEQALIFEHERIVVLQTDLKFKCEQIESLQTDLKLKATRAKELDHTLTLKLWHIGEFEIICVKKDKQIEELENALLLKGEQIATLRNELKIRDEKIMGFELKVDDIKVVNEKSKLFNDKEYESFELTNAVDSRKQAIQKIIANIKSMIANRLTQGSYDYQIDNGQLKYYDEIKFALEYYSYIVSTITNENNGTLVHIEW